MTVVLLEGLGKLKKETLTSSGIEPTNLVKLYISMIYVAYVLLTSTWSSEGVRYTRLHQTVRFALLSVKLFWEKWELGTEGFTILVRAILFRAKTKGHWADC
jgi:hypothetical protein